MKHNIIFLTGLLLFGPTAPAQAQPQKRTPAYAQVHAFFKNYCIACHNEQDVKGGLILESFDTLELGGDNGPVFEPSKADESRIVKVLLGKIEPKMPPKDAPQPKPEEIAVLRAWINAGAEGPEPGAGVPDQPTLPSVPVKVPVVSEVGAVAWGPEGKFLAAGRHDEVLLFDLTGGLLGESDTGASLRSAPATPMPIHRLTGHAGKIAALAFSPDGQLLAAAGGSPGRFGEIKVWNATDGSLVRTIRGHDDAIYALRWSGDGTRLITGSYDRLVKIWDAESGEERSTLKEHTEAVFSLDIAPSPSLPPQAGEGEGGGNWLATASGDRTIKLWDLATGRRRYTLSESLAAVYTVAFRGDGLQLAAGGADKIIRIWDLTDQGPTLARSGFAHDGAVLALTYTPDGQSLISTGEDRLVKRWRVDTLTEEKTFAEQPDWVLALALTPDGSRLAVGRFDGSLALLDAVEGETVGELLAAAPGESESNAPSATASAESAEPGGPSWKPAELSSISPRGAVRGRAVRMTLKGTNLADAFSVAFSDPRITATIVRPEQPTEDKGGLEVEVALPADLKPGMYSVLAQTPFGTTGAKPFAVGALPVSAEQPSEQDPKAPHEVTLPSTLVGTIGNPGDEDLWSFEASSGQTIVFEVVASSLGSQLVAELVLADSQGRVLAETQPTEDRRDPVLAWKFAEAGRYVLRVSDLEYGGGGGFFYRINAGAFPYLTRVFPLAIQRGTSAEIELLGFNLPEGESSRVSLAAPSESADRLPVEPPGEAVASAANRQVIVTDSPSGIENEPNDAIESAVTHPVPFGVSGRIDREAGANVPDFDLYGFEATEGERFAIEVTARRLGSPLDSLVEVLDASGVPVRLFTARPTAQTEVALRDHSSRGDGLRIVSWTDLSVGDRVMVGSELLEVLALPRGPDDNIRFRNFRGQRLGLFGTTPEAHARGAAVYKVQLYPPGQTFPPNGMPVFDLFARNDDGGPVHGADSYYVFEAPAEGTYYVRLSDVRGNESSDHSYHLAVRPLKPDFRLTMSPTHPNVPRGGSIPLEITAERRDGFEGPIAVRLEGLPEGFSATEGTIHAGEFSTTLTLSADDGARQPIFLVTGETPEAPPAPGTGETPVAPNEARNEPEEGLSLHVVGVAEIAGEKVERSASGNHRLTLVPPADIRVWVEPTEVVARPGDEVTFTAYVERLGGFGNRVPVNVRTLRHGARVLDVGLNGVLVRQGESSRQFTVKIEPWIESGSFQFFAVGKVENAGRNEHASPPVVVRVESTGVASGD